MRVLVVGSGLIGLTSAWFLRRAGHEVTIVDRREGPGKETSFANGSLLTPSMAEPWNAPGCWRVLLASIARSDSPLKLRLGALPSLAGWGIGFLGNSSAAAFERNTISNLRLARYSLQVLRDLRGDARIEYGRAARGTLKIYRDDASLEEALAWARRLESYGLVYRSLSKEETIKREPALAPIAGRLAGAIYYEDDESGDAYRFCVALAGQLHALGVTFRHGAEVSSLEMTAGRIMGVVLHNERLIADQYVVAAASYTSLLLEPLGIDVPVRPAKGYSVTFDGRPALTTPVVDDSLHAAIVPLEKAIRVAGTAEFAGFDLTLREERARNLVSLLQEILPRERFDQARAKPWCGLRPLSMDGVPIIGSTRISNLWVNTGHGHLGWTMAAGSGELLADLLCEKTPAIDPAPYSPLRFGGAR